MLSERLKKRELEVKDYENDNQYSRKNEVHTSIFGLNSKLPDDFLDKLENDEIIFKNKIKSVNYLWEVHLMKTKLQFEKYIEININRSSTFEEPITNQTINVMTLHLSSN